MKESIKLMTQNEALSYYPKILYKYRDWENSFHKKIITNKQVYFPCFNELNDEFDGKQPFRFNKDISFDNYKNELEKNNPHEYQKHTEASLNKMYDKLQSEQDWYDNYNNHIKIVNELYGVYSLSYSNINQQLWTNYANSNKGFCIGFDTISLYNSIIGYDEKLASKYINIEAIKKDNNFKGDLQSEFKPTIDYVKYSDEQVLMPFAQENVNKYLNLFFTKQKKWEFEEEIRLLKLFASKKTFKIKKNVIQEIIFGINMTSLHREEIIKEIEKAGFENVTFFEVVKNLETLSFEIKKYNTDE